MLVVGRALQGLGAGALPATAYVAVGRAYPPENRPRMFALFSTAWVVPSLIGPAFSGFIGETVGWRWVFLGLVPLLAVIGVISAFAVRHIPAPETPSRGASLVDALLVATGAGLLVAGLGTEQLALAIVMVAVGALLAVPAFRRLAPPGTLRARAGMPAAVACRGLLTFAFFGSDAYVPFVLTDVRGVRAGVAGLALTAATLMWTTGAWVQDRFVRRIGPRPLVRIGFVAVLAGASLFSLVLFQRTPPALGIAAWGLAGLGMGLAYAPLALTVLSEAKAGQEGAATSGIQLSDTLGTALGTGVAGAVVAFGEGSSWLPRSALLLVFATTVVVAAFGTITATRLPVGEHAFTAVSA
jgi:MFS family permease